MLLCTNPQLSCNLLTLIPEPTRCSTMFYWPARKNKICTLGKSWAKVMFLQASVILSTGGGCLPQCMLGYHLREQTPPQSRPPGSRHPILPPQSRPPWEQTPLSREADASIRSISSWYTSYWNAYLVNISTSR